jgi:sulfate permease, SulP family
VSPPALLRWVPGLALFRDYRREWFGADLLAGVSVCVVMIPSVIAYAGLMGLPPQHGLYAALVPLIVYPFFGSSRQMVVGPDNFFPRLAELAGKLHQAHGTTLLFGLTVLAVIVSLRRLAPKIPPALVVVAAAIGASLALRLEGRGVAVVGAFPGGLPGFALPAADWRDIHTVLPAAIGIALLTYTEGILLARAFAAKNGYEVNPNQELSALGLADVFTGLFQGFSVTGSQSRTTINDSAGGKTQMASLFAAATLFLFLLFLTQLIARLPVVALAALLIYGGFTLVEFDVMVRIYRFYPRSALLAALTTLGVLAVGVVPGILVGVALSLLALIERVSNPPDAVLRIAPGGGFHDLGQESQGQTIPGFIAYRFYAPLLFSNASHFVQRVRGLLAASPVPVRWFLVDAQAITDIDITAAEALRALNQELHQQGIALKFAHTNRPLRKVLERIGFTSEIGRESIFHAVHEAADAFQKS